MKTRYFIFLLLIVLIPISGCDIKTSKVTSDGGIFKSTDFGENWEQKASVFKNEGGITSLNNVNAGFLVFHPKEKNIIYFISNGSGIFKTENSGEQWTITTLNKGTYSGLSIDTRNNKVMYSSEDKTIFKTVDDMETWHQIYLESRKGQSIVTVIVDYFNPNIVYGASTSRLNKSVDYGDEWKPLNWNNNKILQMHQSHKNPDTFYILTDKGVFKTVDGGTNWQLISESLKEYEGANTVYSFTFNPETEVIFLGTAYGIFKNTSGQDIWQPVTTLFEFSKQPIKALTYNPNDLNDIIFSFGSNILHKTDDGGNTWKTLRNTKTSRVINYLTFDPYHEDIIYLGTYMAKKK